MTVSNVNPPLCDQNLALAGVDECSLQGVERSQNHLAFCLRILLGLPEQGKVFHTSKVCLRMKTTIKNLEVVVAFTIMSAFFSI